MHMLQSCHARTFCERTLISELASSSELCTLGEWERDCSRVPGALCGRIPPGLGPLAARACGPFFQTACPKLRP
jgi:hypothetical protein